MWIKRLRDQDLLLLGGFAALALAALFPFFLTPVLPFTDLAANTAMASYFWDAALRSDTAGCHFSIRWTLLPYWTSFLVVALVEPLFGIFAAAKAQAALAMLLLPAGLIRLLGALGRDRRLGLLGFLAVYNYNLYWGFTAYLTGIGFALFALAALVRAETPRQAVRVIPWGFLIGITHLHAAQLFVVAAAAVVLTKPGRGRQLAIYAVGGSGLLVALSPFVYPFVKGLFTGEAKQHSTFDWHPIALKTTALFDHAFGDVGGPGGDQAAVVALVFLLLAPTFALLLPQRRPELRRDLAAAALPLIGFLFYYALPDKIFVPGTSLWFYYPRFLVVALLFLLAIPRPDLRGLRALFLIPGIAAIVYVDVSVARQFAAVAPLVRPIPKLAAMIRPGSHVLPYVFAETAPPLKAIYPFKHLHSYVAAASGSYDPDLFDQAHFPVTYRAKKRLPRPGAEPVPLDPSQIEPYDYIFVQGLDRDPVREGRFQAPAGWFEIRRIAEEGIFRLYEIQKDGPRGGRGESPKVRGLCHD
jgi:hypothetical protein